VLVILVLMVVIVVSVERVSVASEEAGNALRLRASVGSLARDFLEQEQLVRRYVTEATEADATRLDDLQRRVGQRSGDLVDAQTSNADVARRFSVAAAIIAALIAVVGGAVFPSGEAA
jgi:hypothetical protein